MSNIIERYEVTDHALGNNGQLTVKHDNVKANGVDLGTVGIKKKSDGELMILSTDSYMRNYVDEKLNSGSIYGILSFNTPQGLKNALESSIPLLAIATDIIEVDSDLTITLNQSITPQSELIRVIGQDIIISNGATLTILFSDNNTPITIIENNIKINDGRLSFGQSTAPNTSVLVFTGYIENVGSPASIRVISSQLSNCYIENVDPNITFEFSFYYENIIPYESTYAKYGKIKTSVSTSIQLYQQTGITSAIFNGGTTFEEDPAGVASTSSKTVLLNACMLNASGSPQNYSNYSWSALEIRGNDSNLYLTYGSSSGTGTLRTI
jgi:hypothetical protein